MARGWESKAVEAQIEEGKEPVREDKGQQATSVEAKIRQQRLESLRLSRARVLEQLERAQHSAHREVLLKGLQAVEREIDEISSGPAEKNLTDSASENLQR
jgi:hypothetical protein